MVYSNWGSREGKGGQVFGTGDGLGEIPHPGEDTGGNRWAALTFSWTMVERQVRVEGLMEPLSREESEIYWRTRERGSQIGAWASWQSRVLWSSESGEGQDGGDGRDALEKRVNDVQKQFEGVERIPLPPFWGGVRLVPESVEFWQGRRSRLHDRFRYVRVGEGWRIERLSP